LDQGLAKIAGCHQLRLALLPKPAPAPVTEVAGGVVAPSLDDLIVSAMGEMLAVIIDKVSKTWSEDWMILEAGLEIQSGIRFKMRRQGEDVKRLKSWCNYKCKW
jgi:hypothetical protein